MWSQVELFRQSQIWRHPYPYVPWGHSAQNISKQKLIKGFGVTGLQHHRVQPHMFLSVGSRWQYVTSTGSLLEMLLRGPLGVQEREKLCLDVYSSFTCNATKAVQWEVQGKKKGQKCKKGRKLWRNGQGVNKEPEDSDPKKVLVSIQVEPDTRMVLQMCWCKTAKGRSPNTESKMHHTFIDK